MTVELAEPEFVMAYRYRRQESVARGTRRIVRERLRKAMEQLSLSGDDLHEGIHEARKRFKEIRAVLRLVRAELGEHYPAENRWYRDAGRALAEARDAKAALETWDKLRPRFPELCDRQPAEAVGQVLQSRLERMADDRKSIEAARTEVLNLLPGAGERISRWPVTAAGFDGIRQGMRRVYRQGRQCMREAYADPSDLRFHEWRKRVKDLWYHTRLLGAVWRDEMRLREVMLKELSDTLGDDHDLVVLGQLLKSQPHLFGERNFRGELARVLAIRQQALRADAYWMGHLLYVEKPKVHIRRLEAYWRLWRPVQLR